MASKYSVFTTGKADKNLESLPADDRERMLEAILALGDDPRPPGSRKLQGREGYRLRVGNYRALYLIDEGLSEVTIHRIGHRQGIY